MKTAINTATATTRRIYGVECPQWRSFLILSQIWDVKQPISMSFKEGKHSANLFEDQFEIIQYYKITVDSDHI